MKHAATIVIMTSVLGLPSAVSIAAEPLHFKGGDGSSVEQAVVIDAKTEVQGILAERAWVQQHIAGGTIKSQALIPKGRRRYDVLDVQTAEGGSCSVYFDVTAYFGNY